MANEFHKLVHVFSTLVHVCVHVPLMLFIQDSEKAESTLNYLNNVALALTTKAKGNVTAFILKQSATAIQFFYSQNAPCNGSLNVSAGYQGRHSKQRGHWRYTM